MKFIIPVHYNELSELKTISSKTLHPPAIQVMYLLLAENCNYQCSYCYMVSRQQSVYNKHMSTKVIQQSLNFFAKHNDCTENATIPTIIFYGGEPLLNRKGFTYALDYIKQLKKNKKLPEKINLCLNTNGSLITPQLADRIIADGIDVAISIDGRGDDNDVARIYVDGSATLEDTLRGYYLLVERGAEVLISCTIGRHNIDSIENTIMWLIETHKIKRLGFNLMGNTDSETLVDYDFVKSATKKAIRCFELCSHHGVYEGFIGKKVKDFAQRSIVKSSCAACGNQISVTADGRVGPCYAFHRSRYYLNSTISKCFYPRTNSDFLAWSHRSPLSMKECVSCPALSQCGGGCMYEAFLDTGSIWRKDKLHCVHMKEFLEWIVWKVYNNKDVSSFAT
jgi:uncharacterized protein